MVSFSGKEPLNSKPPSTAASNEGADNLPIPLATNSVGNESDPEGAVSNDAEEPPPEGENEVA